MFEKILVAYDDSEGSREALDHAIKLAKKLNCSLRLLWVRSTLPHYPETMDEIEEEAVAANKFFAKIEAQLQVLAEQHGISLPIESKPGHAAQVIVEYAREVSADLLVLGVRGHSGVWGRLLGHTAERVTEHAPCDVLIVH